LIVNMRTRNTQAVGIYYTQWQNADWSSVIPLVDHGSNAESAHYAAVAVRQGNELFVVWNQIGGGEVWLIHGTIQGIAPQPIKPVPIVEASTPVPTPTVSTTSTLVAHAPVINHTPPSAVSSSSSNSFLPGVGLAVVVIAVIFVGMRLRARL
jgi:hypothetical protein